MGACWFSRVHFAHHGLPAQSSGRTRGTGPEARRRSDAWVSLRFGMTPDQERTVVIAETRTAFEAETIAAALRERGVDARVLDSATTQAWGMAIGGVSGVKVVVLEHEVERARKAMEEVRVDSASIDWDGVDLGSDPSVQRLTQVSKSRRWVWTVVMLLVPAGFIVLSVGIHRADPMVKILGGVLLAGALVMGINQVLPERGE